MAGFVVVSIIEIPRLFSIRDERDVRYYLGVPVLAQIPETLTPEEKARGRRLLAARTLGIGLLSFVLVSALVITLNQFGIFQLFASRW